MALRGQYISKDELAEKAIYVEQQILKENVGSQDQISAAFGGFNRIEFLQDGTFMVEPIILPKERKEELQQHLMLCFTGFSRIASQVAKSKIDNLKNRTQELSRMKAMVAEAITILRSQHTSIEEFGKLLHEAWMCKRTLSDQVSTPEVDRIYDAARSAGAIGGKLLGAGGGGFMLLFVRPDQQDKVRERLRDLVHVPFAFENSGSRIVLYQPNGL
jgi:D-glycero-alpha-D-manno-heptose-7-phosphate kinase